MTFNRMDYSRQKITQANEVIDPWIRRTPVFTLPQGSFGLDCVLTLKLENFQYTGSYKPRGVFSRLLAQQDLKTSQTVVAASGGNHGIAVAYAAMKLGFNAEIFVPKLTPISKRNTIAKLGAQINVIGDVYGDALAASQAYANENGFLSIHAFDETELIVGQGTIGLEVDAQYGEPDTVLAAAGGGSLLAGLSAWYADSGVDVIGVEPHTASAVQQSMVAKKPVDVMVSGIAADSLGARSVGTRTFPLISHYTKQMLLVSDDEIKQTMQTLWNDLRLVVEPGAAVAMTALLTGKYIPKTNEKVLVVICGANTSLSHFTDKELTHDA